MIVAWFRALGRMMLENLIFVSVFLFLPHFSFQKLILSNGEGKKRQKHTLSCSQVNIRTLVKVKFSLRKLCALWRSSGLVFGLTVPDLSSLRCTINTSQSQLQSLQSLEWCSEQKLEQSELGLNWMKVDSLASQSVWCHLLNPPESLRSLIDSRNTSYQKKQMN